MRKINKEERLEFARNHSQQEFAERFNLTISTAYQFYTHNKLRYNKGHYKNKIKISESEWIEYAKTHCVSECRVHFKLTYLAILYIEDLYGFRAMRNKGSTKTEINPKIKRTGEAQEMIKFLSQEFTCASIARVFGYSKERIRQICFDLQE